jgi:hypothetical protein
MADQDSYGAKFWLKKKADADYVEVADVMEGDLFKIKKMITERKSLGQPNRYIKKRGTFVDAGSITIKVVFSKTKTTLLKQWVEDPDAWDSRFEVPDDAGSTTEAPKVSRFACDAIGEEMSQPLPADGGRLETDLTVAFSGQPTWTESAVPTVAA